MGTQPANAVDEQRIKSPPTVRGPVRPVDRALARSVDSRSLFAGQRELTIEHDGVAYRLRITQHNKLILTK